MTEESSQTPEETTPPKEVEVSQTEGDSPISLTEAQIEQILVHPSFEAKFGEVAKQKAQSVKDKRIVGLEKGFSEVLERFEEIKSKGFSEEQAKHLMSLEERSPEVEEVGSPPEQVDLDISAMLKAAKLNPDSSRVQDMVKANAGNQNALIAGIVSLATEKEAEQPTGAGVVPTGGGETVKENPISDIDDPAELLAMALN